MDSFKEHILYEALLHTQQITAFLHQIPDTREFIKNKTALWSDDERKGYHSIAEVISILADFLQENDDPRVILVRSQIERIKDYTSSLYGHIEKEMRVLMSNYLNLTNTYSIELFKYDPKSWVNVGIHYPKNNVKKKTILEIHWTLGFERDQDKEDLHNKTRYESFSKSFWLADGKKYLISIGVPESSVDKIDKIIKSRRQL